jgi:hypothetical protein
MRSHRRAKPPSDVTLSLVRSQRPGASNGQEKMMPSLVARALARLKQRAEAPDTREKCSSIRRRDDEGYEDEGMRSPSGRSCRHAHDKNT